MATVNSDYTFVSLDGDTLYRLIIDESGAFDIYKKGPGAKQWRAWKHPVTWKRVAELLLTHVAGDVVITTLDKVDEIYNKAADRILEALHDSVRHSNL